MSEIIVKQGQTLTIHVCGPLAENVDELEDCAIITLDYDQLRSYSAGGILVSHNVEEVGPGKYQKVR